MNPASRLLLLPAALVAAAACTPFESLLKKLPRPGDKPAAEEAAEPQLPLAEATHRFMVGPEEDVVGRLQVTVARHEDTFADIARRFNIGYAELVRANPGVDPWIPGAGTEIVLPTEFVLPDAPREGLVLNLAAMRLYYYPQRPKDAPKDGPVEVITHPIGIGKVGWATPEGSTKVVSRVKDPVWTPPVSVRVEHAKVGDILPEKVPPGPENPLGRHIFAAGPLARRVLPAFAAVGAYSGMAEVLLSGYPVEESSAALQETADSSGESRSAAGRISPSMKSSSRNPRDRCSHPAIG